MSLFDGTSASGTIKLLERGLDASVLRRDVIANNIANVNVPHFKKSRVIFESELRRAVDSQKQSRSEPPLATLHPGHVARREPVSEHSVVPKVHIEYTDSMRNDGNNVDIEEEIALMNKNQMKYSMMADRLGAEFRLHHHMIRLA